MDGATPEPMDSDAEADSTTPVELGTSAESSEPLCPGPNERD